ncbi:hypothetical protein A2U01_0063210, partial [Trifolium medium]|nr:hypothetical protein [Trifolium medium]
SLGTPTLMVVFDNASLRVDGRLKHEKSPCCLTFLLGSSRAIENGCTSLLSFLSHCWRVLALLRQGYERYPAL